MRIVSSPPLPCPSFLPTLVTVPTVKVLTLRVPVLVVAAQNKSYISLTTRLIRTV